MKQEEIKEMPTQDLRDRLVEMQKDYAQLKINHAKISHVLKPSSASANSTTNNLFQNQPTWKKEISAKSELA